MTSSRLGADALLDLVIEMLRLEMAPVLPSDTRYTCAMMINALEIARRESAGEDEAAAFALLDAVYEDGDGTMQRLAKDIRTGEVDAKLTPKLPHLLRAQLVAELKVRNPRLLKTRGIKA